MTEQTTFETNLEALAKISPNEAKKIREFFPGIKHRLYPVVPLGADHFNVSPPMPKTVGRPLFQTTDATREIDQWIKNSKIQDGPCHAAVVLGFELGYFCQALLQRLPSNGVMAIVEPDPMMFFSAFQSVDLADVLGDERVHLVIGQTLEKSVESVGRELQWARFLALPYRILATPLLSHRLPKFSKDFASIWRDALQRELMYRNSRVEHGTEVVAHTVANTKAMILHPGVSTLYHHFQKVPAILVSPGPSLEQNIEYLKQFRRRMLLACVNTAYPVLRKHGIEPDLVVTMDHHERNAGSFQDYPPTEQSFLVADPRIAPEIIQRFHPRVFIASWKSTAETTGEPMPLDRVPIPKKSGNAFFSWLQEWCGAKGDVFGAGSVAVAAFHILARMGCRPIILAGQDLAFPGKKQYASGTIFDDKNLPRDAEAMHEVPSVDGGTVATSDTLHLYRQLMEHEIARFKVPVFNTSSGAAINGTITTRFPSLDLELPESVVNVADVMRSIQASYKPTVDAIDLQRCLAEAVRKLQWLSETARRSLNQVPDLEEVTDTERKKDLLVQVQDWIRTCRSEHEEAFDMLNELLQESHYKFEDGKWRTMLYEDDGEAAGDRLRCHVMVLDEFVKQTNFLITLLEEKIHRLDR